MLCDISSFFCFFSFFLVSILVFCFATSASSSCFSSCLGNNIYRDTYVNDIRVAGAGGVAPTALWQYVYRLSKSATQQGLRGRGSRGWWNLSGSISSNIRRGDGAAQG